MTDPNQPAFPGPAGGLTKREYFAAKLLASIAGNDAMLSVAGCKDRDNPEKYLSILALEMADALIAELNKAAQ